jgi:hypothetical protein
VIFWVVFFHSFEGGRLVLPVQHRFPSFKGVIRRNKAEWASFPPFEVPRCRVL